MPHYTIIIAAFLAFGLTGAPPEEMARIVGGYIGK